MTDTPQSFETEKDSALVSIKSKINNVKKHHASKVRSDEHQNKECSNPFESDINDRAPDKLDNLVESFQYTFSDDSLIRSNIAPSIFENDKQTPSSEKNYQISLLSFQDRKPEYTENNENNTMILMMLMIIVIAITLFLIVRSVEKNEETDHITVYNITANAVNNDPSLAPHRYMHAM